MAKRDTLEWEHERPEKELDAQEIARRIQIGRFLDNELRKKGWTQTQLAKKAGCTQSMVSRVLAGQTGSTDELLSWLLEALGLKHDAIDKLPGLGFDPGSDGFQLKLLIIRALIAGEIPTDETLDARDFIENQWDYPAFRDAPRSANLDDAVWASLIADGYFRVDDEGQYLPLPLYFDLKGNLLLCVAAMVSGMSRVRNFPAKLRPKVIADVDAALRYWKESLNKPEQLAAAIDALSYSAAGGDRMLVAALLGHAAGLKFFLEVGASAIASNAEHYSSIVMPFFQALLDSLKMARDQLLSDSPDPISKIMSSLGQAFDEIIEQWKAQGMVDPKNESP